MLDMLKLGSTARVRVNFFAHVIGFGTFVSACSALAKPGLLETRALEGSLLIDISLWFACLISLLVRELFVVLVLAFLLLSLFLSKVLVDNNHHNYFHVQLFFPSCT